MKIPNYLPQITSLRRCRSRCRFRCCCHCRCCFNITYVIEFGQVADQTESEVAIFVSESELLEGQLFPIIGKLGHNSTQRLQGVKFLSQTSNRTVE